MIALTGAATAASAQAFDRVWDNNNAAIKWNENTSYIFKASDYLRYDTGAGIPPGHPKSIAGNWPGWPRGWSSIDAAIMWNDNVAYFFKGDEYIRYDVGKGVANGYPKSIAGNWPGWPQSWHSIDAAIMWNNDVAYFFKGNEYIRYDVGKGVPNGYPATIEGDWPGWPRNWNSVDAAIMWNDNVAYFFKGAEYIRYDVGKGVPDGYPATIEGNWPGRNELYHKRLDEISFLGTHNSGAGYRGKLYYYGTDTAAGSALYRDQELTFTEQLEKGVRFFDIDTGYLDPESTDDDWWRPAGAWITHAKAWAGPVQDLIDQADEWLQDNPNDILIIYFNGNVHEPAGVADAKEKIANDVVRMVQSKWGPAKTGVRQPAVSPNQPAAWPKFRDAIENDKRVFVFMHASLGAYISAFVPSNMINFVHWDSDPDSYKGDPLFANAYYGNSDEYSGKIAVSCSGVVDMARDLCDSNAPFVILSLIAKTPAKTERSCPDYYSEAVKACAKQREAHGKGVNVVLVDSFGTGGEGSGANNIVDIVKSLNR